ncbi:MAG: hypothetical protein KDI90_04025, partial [Alphaproteobacteria bacterium]|nr:hypothetical protein [Alphaproteobacteria bacterium]
SSPAGIASFLDNDSPHSLHDSWITSFQVNEVRNPERPFDPKVYIELHLLGPMHDRDFLLKYSCVEGYQLYGRKNKLNWADTFHGDILFHEFRLQNDRLFVHEMILRSDSKIQISSGDFSFLETLHLA